MARVRTGTQFAVTPLYEYFQVVDRDHPGKKTAKVPLALQISFRHFGNPMGGADFLLLIDRSGSMTKTDVGAWAGAKTRWEALLRALLEMKDWLRPEDRVALIPFDSSAKPPLEGFQPSDRLAALVDQLPAPAQGATNFCPALEAAIKTCTAADSTRPRVVLLLTDGKIEKTGNPDGDSHEADRALGLVEELAGAGVDFAALGFGDEYDENYLQKLVARAGLKRVNYIKDDKVARDAFERIIDEQQHIAMTGARVVAVLNIDTFKFLGVRSFLPEGTGTVDVKLGKDDSIGGFLGRRWELPMPNIRDSSAGKVDYLLFLEAEPKEKLGAGQYPIGSFELRGREGGLISGGAIRVDLTVTAERIKPAWSSPQNPDPDVYINWRQSKKVDLVIEINNLKGTPSASDKIKKKAEAIREILIEGGPGCAGELAAFEANYGDLLRGSATGNQLKDLNQYISVSTKTAAEVIDNFYRGPGAVNTPGLEQPTRIRRPFR